MRLQPMGQHRGEFVGSLGLTIAKAEIDVDRTVRSSHDNGLIAREKSQPGEPTSGRDDPFFLRQHRLIETPGVVSIKDAGPIGDEHLVPRFGHQNARHLHALGQVGKAGCIHLAGRLLRQHVGLALDKTQTGDPPGVHRDKRPCGPLHGSTHPIIHGHNGHAGLGDLLGGIELELKRDSPNLLSGNCGINGLAVRAVPPIQRLQPRRPFLRRQDFSLHHDSAELDGAVVKPERGVPALQGPVVRRGLSLTEIQIGRTQPRTGLDVEHVNPTLRRHGHPDGLVFIHDGRQEGAFSAGGRVLDPGFDLSSTEQGHHDRREKHHDSKHGEDDGKSPDGDGYVGGLIDDMDRSPDFFGTAIGGGMPGWVRVRIGQIDRVRVHRTSSPIRGMFNGR